MRAIHSYAFHHLINFGNANPDVLFTCFATPRSQVPQHLSPRRMLQRRANQPLQGQDRHDTGRAIRVPATLQVSKYTLHPFTILQLQCYHIQIQKKTNHFSFPYHSLL